jgi:hypothetical protein
MTGKTRNNPKVRVADGATALLERIRAERTGKVNGSPNPKRTELSRKSVIRN